MSKPFQYYGIIVVTLTNFVVKCKALCNNLGIYTYISVSEMYLLHDKKKESHGMHVMHLSFHFTRYL